MSLFRYDYMKPPLSFLFPLLHSNSAEVVHSQLSLSLPSSPSPCKMIYSTFLQFFLDPVILPIIDILRNPSLWITIVSQQQLSRTVPQHTGVSWQFEEDHWVCEPLPAAWCALPIVKKILMVYLYHFGPYQCAMRWQRLKTAVIEMVSPVNSLPMPFSHFIYLSKWQYFLATQSCVYYKESPIVGLLSGK